MLYPTLDQLTRIVGNRYLLVNIVTKRAKEIAEKAELEGVKLTAKPLNLAVEEILNSANQADNPANQEQTGK
jgi:DNA-directed RNA polymerase subunit omega